MKKILFLGALISALFMTTGCALVSNDSEVVVEVTDVNGNHPIGEKVYLYSGKADDATLADPSKAKDVQLTAGEYGAARFTISKGEFLIDSQVAFIFQTFDSKGNVNGQVAATVKRNGMMNVHLNQFANTEPDPKPDPEPDPDPEDDKDLLNYVDLALPSGTLWESDMYAMTNHISYQDALAEFGDKIPTKEQWNELIANCTWVWNDYGYTVTGKNGNSIELGAYGYWLDGEIINAYDEGSYWSRTEEKDGIYTYVYTLLINYTGKWVQTVNSNAAPRSVRLVKNPK